MLDLTLRILYNLLDMKNSKQYKLHINAFYDADSDFLLSAENLFFKNFNGIISSID